MGSASLIITGIILLILFSGSGIAIRFVNRIRIEIEVRKSLLTARILNYFLKNRLTFSSFILLGKLLSGMLILPGLFLLIHNPEGFSSGPYAAPSELIVVFVAGVVLLPLCLLLAEKLFLLRPAESLHLMSIPLFLLYILLYLPARILSHAAAHLAKNASDDQLAQASVDLTILAALAMDDEKNEEELDAEVRIFQNALEFNEVILKECMIPRTEIIGLDIENSIEELRTVFVNTGLSRVIIYRENIDNVLGYVRSIELFKNPEKISSVLTTLPFVKEDITANQMLELFIREKRNIAIVLDEFGGTAGLITIEDIIEEIFGEIEDEHDTTSIATEIIGNNEFIFSARIEIDEINEKFNLEIPRSHEYNTLSGFILHIYKDIPEEGELIKLKDLDIEILKCTDTRIELVRLIKKEE